MKTLGFIGTGGMGSGMAANLIKAGYRLVVNDLRRDQARGLEGQGAQFKDSPKAVAESCELVLSMLPNNDAVRAVGLGKVGNAKLVKNAMAMLAAVQHLSLVEICCWLRKGGLDEATFQTIIKNSQQDSVATRRIMEILVSRKYKPRKSWMPKDVGFGLDMAREMEVPMPFVGLAYQMFAIAQATGQDGYEATGIACNVYDVINGNKLE